MWKKYEKKQAYLQILKRLMPGTSLFKFLEWVFIKPSSVPPSGDNHLSSPEITLRLKRHNPKGSAGSFIPFLFGLTPNGVYQANKLPYCWWALTSPFHPYRTSRRFTFLWHYPWGYPRRTLSGILPYGARTFLVCLS